MWMCNIHREERIKQTPMDPHPSLWRRKLPIPWGLLLNSSWNLNQNACIQSLTDWLIHSLAKCAWVPTNRCRRLVSVPLEWRGVGGQSDTSQRCASGANPAGPSRAGVVSACRHFGQKLLVPAVRGASGRSRAGGGGRARGGIVSGARSCICLL